MTKKIYKETYFQHDRYARQDPKIKSMLVHFRKESEQKAQAAVCIYWWIVEDMHTDDYPINKLEVFADDYRCDVNFLKSILEDFELFHVENNCYVSNRVLRNLKEQEEKSEKARKSAQKRWGKHKKDTPAEGEVKQLPEYDEELVLSIIQIFNKEFKKSQIVSKENKAKIFKIHIENKLSIDDWKKIFSNARRGWDIGERKNVKPNLKTILAEWDSFASDDYFLAPDREAAAEKKEREERAKRQEEIERAKRNQQDDRKRKEYFNAVNNKEKALEFLYKYAIGLKSLYKTDRRYITNNTDFKHFNEAFGLTAEDVIEYMQAREVETNG